jgi:outer membrane immunogenic protein
MKRTLAAATLLAAAASTAHAQTWDGGYVGVNLGYVNGTADLDQRDGTTNQRVSTDMDYSGWDGGIYGGFRLMPRGNIVLAGEVGGNWSSADGTTNNTLFNNTRMTVEKTSEVYVSFKGGAEVQPLLLLYGIGGLQSGSFDFKVRNTATGSRSNTDDSVGGWHLGAGAEYAVTPAVSARFEYKYQSYDSFNWNRGGNRVKVEPDENSFRFGVSYNF